MYREETKKGTILLDEDKKYVKSLGPGTNKKVNAVCPMCGYERETSYSNIAEAGHSRCQGCSLTFNTSGWMIGKTFGRLFVKGFGTPFIDPKTGNKHPSFICVCDCGTKVTVRVAAIKSGVTTSCGCYNKEINTERCRSQIGKDHPSYNHNLTDEEREVRDRTDANSRKFKQAVKKRDGCCVVCDSKEKLEVHHLDDFKTNKDKRYELSNGVTVCRPCHQEFHFKFMGGTKVPCTAKDFQKFLNSKKRNWSVQSVGKSIFSSLLVTNQR